MGDNVDYGFFGSTLKSALEIDTFRTTLLALMLFVLECNDTHMLRGHDTYKRYHQRLQTYRSNNTISKVICDLFIKVHRDSDLVTRCAIECDFEIIVSVVKMYFTQVDVEMVNREVHTIRSYLKKQIAENE